MKKLDLSGTGIGTDGLRYILEMLDENSVITDIVSTFFTSLRKHAYSNILKILPPKSENFQIKKSDIFHDSAQNIDCEYSLEPPR